MRMLKIGLILVAVIAIGVVGVLAVAYNTASKLIDEGIAELCSDAVDTEIAVQKPDPAIQPSTPDNVSTDHQEQPNTTDSDTVDNQGDPNSSPSTEETPADNNGSKSTGLEQSEAPAISVDKEQLQQVSSEIPVKEKVEVTKMVVSKLSSAEINELKAMAAGGVNAEEKKKAIDMVYSKFTAEEIEYIKSLYNKYLK